MYSGKLVFAQVMDHLPMHTFRRAVSRYGGNRYVKSFPCHSQFLCMAFAQLTYRESLRDIEVCLRAQRQKLYHLGIRSPVSRNTLANANKQRDWRIYAEVAQALIRIARPMYASEKLGTGPRVDTVFALDASTIDLCLSMFPWAPFQSTKAAVKLHTLLDLRGPIPTFLHVSDGKYGRRSRARPSSSAEHPCLLRDLMRAYLKYRRTPGCLRHSVGIARNIGVIWKYAGSARFSAPNHEWRHRRLRCEQTIVITAADSTSRSSAAASVAVQVLG